MRPTFPTGRGLLVEAFLLDFAGDIYGREMWLDFVERLRGERRFAGVDALVEQMGADVEETRGSGGSPREHGLADDAEPTAFEDEVLVRRRRWASDETGFAVVDADRDGDEVVLVGPLAHLEERERVRISGGWQDDRRFGMQVKVATAEPLAPSGDDALIAYLRRVKHVGRGRAARCSSATATTCSRRSTATRAPRSARSGSARRANEAVRSWNALRSTRALHLLLAPHGLAWLVPADRQALRRRARTTSCASGRTS